ncbi:calcium-binding tyrosine phosphorylation-regulated protein [Ctenodactylus gundi]
MISSKTRLVIPYGLKTLLEGVSRAILKTHPSNITQFAAVYFKELMAFREGNSCLDIKDLVKQFHQLKVEKWTEGMTPEKKPESVKVPETTSVVSQEPARMEKSTDTEEDNVPVAQFSSKTTQFPSVHAQHPETAEAICGPPSKPATPKAATPPPSASPAPEFAYVPADPAQFAAQMLGNVPSTHSDESDVLMVDVATSMPVVVEEVPSIEIAEEVVVAAPLVCSGEVQFVSQTSVQVDVGPKPKDRNAEPSAASSTPLQDEQEPPAYDQAPKASLQADTQVTSALHISSIYNNVPVTEGVVYVEQIPGHTAIPFTDQAACLKEKEQSTPVSPKGLVHKTASGTSVKLVESVKHANLVDTTHQPLVCMEAEAIVLLSTTAMQGQLEASAQLLDAEGFIETLPAKSLHLEVEIMSVDIPGQEESLENSAPLEAEPSGATAGAPGESSSGPFPPVPEGLTDPEMELKGEATPEQV